ncbi:hypothetical protein FRB94_000290 [Tulasnella sp. JGI-2019a]|nr:hypothetical protein FRB93_003220 [Tulasnella sp. JGI-2019a]KAG9006879.1 hypothetical protein FRB94_000290 [Tulasnella sp. JGI-2019a]KAG9032226.1 hypothetical protein FRB95_001705 [Tulasnella sp. JGI-2019a]
MAVGPPSAINPDTGLPWSVRNDSTFGYVPTLGVCILFVALFSITTLAHVYQAFRYRVKKWWIPTVATCGLVEVIGWSGRIWGSQNIWGQNPYIMQIVCTIFAPSFMTAAFFVTFVRIVTIIGPEYSRLSPRIYTALFVGVDVIALVIQSIGGGMAASANTAQGSESGSHVMVGGIILQMAAITIYSLTGIEYFWRVFTERPLRARNVAGSQEAPSLPQSETPTLDTAAAEKSKYVSASGHRGTDNLTPNVKLMLWGLTIATVLILIRSVYRTIELLDGWGGPIITNQVLFDTLDGVPVFLAMVTLNVLHPGRLIPENAGNPSGFEAA